MRAERFDAGRNGTDAARAHLYSVCEQNDGGITVMKGFAGGRLFDENRSPFGVCLTPVQCIHYALTRPAVSSVLCGYDTKEQVAPAVASENASREEKDFASVIANAPLHAYRGQCTYCGHCKPCPAGRDIGMSNKFYDLATMQPEVPATVRSHYAALDGTQLKSATDNAGTFDGRNADIRYSLNGLTWDEMVARYGAKPAGAEPRTRDEAVPERAGDEQRVSDFLRSFVESDKATDEMVAQVRAAVENGDNRKPYANILTEKYREKRRVQSLRQTAWMCSSINWI